MNKKTEESRIAYNKIASEYDASREGQYTRFHIMELSNTIDLHEGNVVLDVACGNGTLLRELSKKAKIQANGMKLSRLFDTFPKRIFSSCFLHGFEVLLSL